MNTSDKMILKKYEGKTCDKCLHSGESLKTGKGYCFSWLEEITETSHFECGEFINKVSAKKGSVK